MSAIELVTLAAPHSTATLRLGEPCANAVQDSAQPSAIEKRQRNPLFIPTWSIQALLPELPLSFPVDADLPPSPKVRYRSEYLYPGPEPLLDPTRLANLTDFQVALHLIDFSPLERALAHIYVPSLKGQVAFHPVSMFLCICLRREQSLPWGDLAQLLAGDDGANWRRLFGFEGSQTPSASGLRYFFNVVGAEVFDDLCPRSVTLLQEHGLFPQTSTYPGDSPERGISVTQDGMLHPARSRPSCELSDVPCYQPLAEPCSQPQPEPAAPAKTEDEGEESAATRPCRARDKGLPGCACDTPACQGQCRRASSLDPEARFIHYSGHNHKHGDADDSHSEADSPPEGRGRGAGINIFGYRSVADRAIDDRFSIAWNLHSMLYPANTDERAIFQQRLEALKAKFPDLRISEWLDDAGVGYGPCLEAIYDLGALRMVDTRADPSDRDPQACVQRGYDGRGCPLCQHGYALRSNGYDYERRRTKYVCAQVCRREPLHKGEAIRPVEGCPYLDEARPSGYVVNVGKTMPDGSIRLAREIPYGSPTWQARYGRRNLSESRNGQIEGLGLKRMKSYGLPRNTKEVQVADFLLNLHTLGRLVREATNLRVA